MNSGDELGRLAARVNDMADRPVVMLGSLRESEGRLERAQRVARVGWWERDRATGRLTFSEVIAELYGVDERNRTGEWKQVLRTFLHPDDCNRVIEAAEAALHGGARFDVEYRVVLRDGGVRVVHGQGDVTRDESGRPLRHFGVAQDITERKQAEHALRRSEHYLAEAQRLSRTGSWALDPATGKASYWSEEMFRIHGLDPKRSHPPDMDELPRLWHPDERGWVVERIRTTIRDGAEYAAEHRLVLPDGTTKHLRAIGHPLLDDAGSLVEYIGTVMDITDRKRAEEALQKAQSELAHVTRVTTVNALASSIAHEVNQPLAAVVAGAGAALRWLAHEPPELDEAREMRRHIVEDGQRAGAVIGRVRELLRKSAVVKAQLNLKDLIDETVALVHGEAGRQRIVLRTELGPDLPEVEGDPVQLQQVLLNLMLNGIEAMEDVTERTCELLLRSQPDGSSGVLISVQDTGVGLNPRSVERVFEAFYTTKPEGLGMGLSICRSILEAHGGRLWACARRPHGTVFHFTVPSSPT